MAEINKTSSPSISNQLTAGQIGDIEAFLQQMEGIRPLDQNDRLYLKDHQPHPSSGTKILDTKVLLLRARERYQDAREIKQFKAVEEDFLAASQAQNAEAFRNLGFLYLNGKLGQKEPELAYKNYMMAAELGDAKSQYAVGYMSRSGIGTKPDLSVARKYYEMAANQDDADGLYAVGYLHHNAEAAPKNSEEAFYYFRRSAEKGHMHGQFIVGVMYQWGDGITPDRDQALKWYDLSQKQGHIEARARLGRLYIDGEGIPQKPELALELLEDAAARGNNTALEALGDMHAKGITFKQNPEKALELYFRADSKGNDSLQKKIDDVKIAISSSKLLKSKASISNPKVARTTAPNILPNGDQPPPLDKKEKIKTLFLDASNPNQLSKALKTARKEAGFTQVEVAELMGTRQGAIQRLESGKHNPTIDSLWRYAEAIGYKLQISFQPDK